MAIPERWGAATLVMSLALGACSSQGPVQEPSPVPSGTAVSPVATGQTEPSMAPTGQAGQWDPSQWEPTVQVTLTRLTETEREQWREDYLSSLTQDLDGPVPSVALERWVHPRGEQDEVMGACMADSGFPVKIDQGSISYPGGPPPADQLSAWSLAWYTCNARFTPEPDYSQDWTEEQLGLVYDYWDQYFIPCMEAHGHPINRAQQPSRALYVSTFFTPQRTSWWPNESLAVLPESEREQLESVCAPYPPDEAFFGT